MKTRRKLLFLLGGIVIILFLQWQLSQPLRLNRLSKTSNEVKLGQDLEINLSKTQAMEFVWIEDLKMWVGKYEVTFGQYCCAYSPVRLLLRYGIENHCDYYSYEKIAKSLPTVMISWKEAKKYCNWLKKHYRDILPEGYQFRLPTEEEWESFARCGDNRTYPWGNEWPPQRMKDDIYPNYMDEKAKLGEPIPDYSDGWEVSCPVQKSGMNDWGLYGVGGNVEEWCEGWHPTKKGIRIMKGAAYLSSHESHLKIVEKSVKEVYAYLDASGFRVVIGKVL